MKGRYEKKTLITASFVIATVLQGISYPAIALAADNASVDQNETPSSLVSEQNNAAENTDAQNDGAPDASEASGDSIKTETANGDENNQASEGTTTQPENSRGRWFLRCI